MADLDLNAGPNRRAGSREDNPVRIARVEKGLTQAQLGDAVGVSRKTINVIESGGAYPSLKIGMQLSSELGRTLETLFP
jgi:putative transcriptional regulator